MLDTLRLRVAVRFLSIYPKDGVEEILRSTTEEFEKSKKACIYKNVLKPCQGGNQQNNRGRKYYTLCSLLRSLIYETWLSDICLFFDLKTFHVTLLHVWLT